MTVGTAEAMLAELRRIRAALERPNVEPVYVDYATAAKMLCCSKRSVERLVSEKRLRTIDVAGPKLRVADLRALGERKRITRKVRQQKDLDSVVEEARAAEKSGSKK